MTPAVLITYLVVSFLFVLFFTAFIRGYSLKRSLIDVPNARSSHESPTPRGGGLAISLAVLLTALIFYGLDFFNQYDTLALLAGGILVSLIGWLDDHLDLPAIMKGMGYLLAAIWTVYWLGGSYTVIGQSALLSWTVTIMVVIGMTWMINLYNFMDGTDAIAAIEAITVSLFAGYLMYGTSQHDLAVFCFVIAAANAGFLYWNWPPAKIFMGDVGSCLIGFIFACLMIMTVKTGTLGLMVWLILLAVFIADATLTLMMRIIKRERWYSAHRSHAYQRLVQSGLTHTQLALAVLLVNCLLSWPLAYLAHLKPELDWAVALVTYLVMTVIWCMIQGHYHRTTIKGDIH